MLDKSGYKTQLEYTATNTSATESSRRKKKRKNRDVIWYNPPFNRGTKTNLGKEFLALIDKNFPKRNPLSKIINRKTVKIGYSCTKNMQATIQGHNQKIMAKRENTGEENEGCNCRAKENCPLDGKCLTKSVVYKASLPDGHSYIGCTGSTFKQRYNGHTSSFRNEKYKANTTLSSYVWENNINPQTIKWSIVQKAKSYSPGQKMCSLCLAEKFNILTNNNSKSLNRRDEIGQRCPHARATKLAAFKPP